MRQNRHSACEVCKKQLEHPTSYTELVPHVAITFKNRTIARYCVDCFNESAPSIITARLDSDPDPYVHSFVCTAEKLLSQNLLDLGQVTHVACAHCNTPIKHVFFTYGDFLKNLVLNNKPPFQFFCGGCAKCITMVRVEK